MANSHLSQLDLKLDALSCRRGERLLFANLSLAIKGGEMVEIKGPNGVGKSSLLRILSGLLPAENGTIALSLSTSSASASASNDDTTSSLSEQAHYLGHRNILKSAFSVQDNLAFWRDFSLTPALTPLEALQRLGLEHLIHLPCGVLSAGQQRRAAFARLLVAHRPIWLLDEPTAGLDKAADALVGGLISDHVKTGGIVMAATHLPLVLDVPDSAHHVIEILDYQPDAYFAPDTNFAGEAL